MLGFGTKMTRVPVPCLDCGQVVSDGRARCLRCRRAREAARNRQPKRQAYRDPAYLSIPLGGICWICGLPGADTRDHVIPLALGGFNDPSNIRPAHRACNAGRGAPSIAE